MATQDAISLSVVIPAYNEDASIEKCITTPEAAPRDITVGAIALDDPTHYSFMRDVHAAYVRQATLFSDPHEFLPVTGGIVGRPEYLYVPKPGMMRAGP